MAQNGYAVRSPIQLQYVFLKTDVLFKTTGFVQTNQILYRQYCNYRNGLKKENSKQQAVQSSPIKRQEYLLQNCVKNSLQRWWKSQSSILPQNFRTGVQPAVLTILRDPGPWTYHYPPYSLLDSGFIPPQVFYDRIAESIPFVKIFSFYFFNSKDAIT